MYRPDGYLYRLDGLIGGQYGDKENGAFFSHMNVMFAYALYKQGKVKEAWHVAHSLYAMSLATEKSKIYPCLPEYFDITGRGMYSYLTGSASWFVLTLLTQSLGIKGENGDLVCEPKLCKEQFGNSTFIALKRSFAGRSLLIRFHNPERLDWGEYQIRSITCDESDVPEIEINGIKAVIKRKFILSLSKNRVHTVNILFSR